MQRIVNSEEMKWCDENAIHFFEMPSTVLMERAALSVVDELTARRVCTARTLVVCGSGNNGADGFAIARLLAQRGSHVTVVETGNAEKATEENRLQRRILEHFGIEVRREWDSAQTFDCVVDALFGVGLSRAPDGVYAELICGMNALCAYKVAVDVPSGVSSDTGAVYEAAFAADLTVTFAYPKLGQLLFPGADNCGTLVTAQIGITDACWLKKRPSFYALSGADLQRLPARPARGHKGTFGRVLVIAGSKNMAGAAFFCAQAAYRAGCGLVRIYTPKENRQVLQSLLPEAVLTTYDTQPLKKERLTEALQWADAVAIGPGLGTDMRAQRILAAVLSAAHVPLVLDADALNIVAKNMDALLAYEGPLAVTPHLGEMSRLTHVPVSELKNKLPQAAKEFAARCGAVCVLKDARTVTALPDGTAYVNTSGTPAMAKGGSGDILTGLIAGLAAQGMDIREAAPLGVYVHGLAGEKAEENKGAYSVLATDILDALCTVMNRGKKENENI